ncbi:HAD family hydrolase [Dinoroseobacter sp. S124A]|uniref:HAD family hydrolase n=1 Tax=Dinoroseobacter sp. S124A TaxID=3415128 RepID=UPI003C7AE9B3
MLRAIVFDKDGTLFDFHETWSGWAATALDTLAKGDRALVAQLSDAIGYDLVLGHFRSDSPAIAGTSAEIAVLLAPYLPDWEEEALLLELNLLAETVTLAEATPLKPLMAELGARNLYLGVATNDSEEGARRQLADAGIAEDVDLVLGYDSGFGAKPDPGMLLAFCDHFTLSPDEVLMVGDSTHDLRAGRAAGMQTVGVLTGVAETPELAPHADLILQDVGHLPAWLDTQRLPLRRRRASA